MRAFLWIVLVASVACALLFWWWRDAAALEVGTEHPRRGTLQVGADEDGVVRSGVESVVASRTAGRIRDIRVKDGERVRAGQVVAVLDGSELEAQLEEARAEVRRARAQVTDVQATIRSHVETAGADVQSAQAARIAASARCDMLVNGSRPEDRHRAEALHQQADAALWEAQRHEQRARRLFDQGYVPQKDLDAARSTLRQAQARQKAAAADLARVRNGSRPEEIREARASVAQATAGIEAAQARLRKANKGEAQVTAALSAVEAAQARVRQLETRQRDVTLAAPRQGVVTLEDVSVGDVVAAGMAVARIVDPQQTWVEAWIDENDLRAVREGLAVLVTTDAWPDETLQGQLKLIRGQAVSRRRGDVVGGRGEDRIFKARVEVVDPKHRLRPGMTVYLQLVTGVHKDVLTLSREAVSPHEDGWMAWVLKGDRAEARPVVLGARDARKVEVKSGLTESDTVIVGGRDLLKPGMRVRVRVKS